MQASEAYSKIVLTNGIVVERKGKNSALKVTDPSGMKAGQKLLDDFIEELALNLPKFLHMDAKGKADVLAFHLGNRTAVESHRRRGKGSIR